LNTRKKDIIGLGLESSCDETAVAVVKNGSEILTNYIFSQIDLHREYAGVVPEIASRAHLEVINELIRRAMEDAKIRFDHLHYVSSTNRPGLIGSLLIGLQTAKAMSYTLNIPLIAINHLEAHLYAPFLEGREISFPFIGLLISGGNTALYQVNGIGELETIGKTVDDAVGEAFDKISKFLNLGYPGGPIIEQLAKKSRSKRAIFPKILADSQKDDFRFSYSGLKTAVITYIKKNTTADRAHIVYSFQEQALELLVRRVFTAARDRSIKYIVVAGGVAANRRIRELLMENKKDDEEIIIPSTKLCTDNAAMVAGIAYHYYVLGKTDKLTVDVMARV
jgi:N6-L-threonylcarbamoyladenine synthase